MKPGKFVFHAPENLDVVFQLLDLHGDDAKIIAGGQSLIPVMNLRLAQPEHLIDINAIADLVGIDVENGLITVGALTRHGEIESSPLLAEHCPLLPYAASRIGHLAIRNRGTIGGSLCNADPAAEWSQMAILMDAEIIIRSARGERRMLAVDFIQSVYTVDLNEDEILTTVIFPALRPGEGWSFQQICRRAGDFAIVSAAATISLDSNSNIERLRLCLGGMDATPLRLTDLEQGAIGKVPDDSWIEEASAATTVIGSPETDMHASETYRREMAAHLSAKALKEALQRCAGGV